MNKQRVLVVDDDCRVTEFIGLVLRSQGYMVRTQNDSVGAARVAQLFSPDLILLDVTMPYKDGGQVAQELRSFHTTARVPIIFVTSIVSEDEVAGGVRSGEDFLPKPVRPASLTARVRQKLYTSNEQEDTHGIRRLHHSRC